MRHSSSTRRRNRNGRKNNQHKMQVFDSNGPDVRIRGTAYQIHEKYLTLAKDALAAGDEVMYQNYLQHAEHYQRVINSWDGDSVSSSDVAPSKRTRNSCDEELGLPPSLIAEPKVESGAKSENNNERVPEGV